ncbi:MAG: hypothetical protein WCD53_18610 [Microcoleus sp.]
MGATRGRSQCRENKGDRSLRFGMGEGRSQCRETKGACYPISNKALFIDRVQSASFMQNTGFLLQNFTCASPTLADNSFEVS